LDQNNTLTTFIIASIVTILLLCYVFALDDDGDSSGPCIQQQISGNIIFPKI